MAQRVQDNGFVTVNPMFVAARSFRDDRVPSIDRRMRRLARTRPMRVVDGMLWPLFPLGLPGSYIAIAYATARALHKRGRAGGPAIVSSAWLGWLSQRAIKLVYKRDRPRRRGVEPRTDSYPSGHTTGATALALTTAYVLRRRRLISRERAVALATIAPVIMGAYRVISDEHWATDVLGGWLLGGVVALGCSAALADSFGGAARRFTGREGSPRVVHRHGRREPPRFAAGAGRAGFPGARVGRPQPFVR